MKQHYKRILLIAVILIGQFFFVTIGRDTILWLFGGYESESLYVFLRHTYLLLIVAILGTRPENVSSSGKADVEPENKESTKGS